MTFPEQANLEQTSLERDAETVDTPTGEVEGSAALQTFDAMDATQTALYERIQTFDIDDVEDSLSFSQRLARDNGWPLKFALRVIEEYRRFVFLAIAADHPVTPSDHVDQAWHLHLAYSRSYWEDFCSRVLETPLHHEPTKGGEAEGEKFDDWYQQTLASYERFFDEVPPEEIWPEAKVRFGRDIDFVRVNTQQKWVISKLPVPREVVGAVVAVLVVGSWLNVLQHGFQHGARTLNPLGGLLVAVLAALASYGLIQFGASFLDALNKPKGLGGCAAGGGGGCGGCGGCCGCGGGGCGGC